MRAEENEVQATTGLAHCPERLPGHRTGRGTLQNPVDRLSGGNSRVFGAVRCLLYRENPQVCALDLEDPAPAVIVNYMPHVKKVM